MERLDLRKMAGILMFIGGVQWVLVVLIAEGLHPGYVSSIYYVSSLGVGSTALIYNSSVILLGVSVAAASFLIRQFNSSKIYFALILLTGIATVGIGVFPENQPPMHGIVTPIALFAGGLSAIFSFKVVDKPNSYFGLALGATSIISGMIFLPYMGLPRESVASYMGLFKGTMERIVIYPLLLWIISFGSQLSGYTTTRT